MYILLIEDDPQDIELARIALDRSGLEVGVVAVPDEVRAVDHLNRVGERPVVVFLDLMLEHTRGADLIAAIRKLPGLEWVPIVMLTTSHDRRDVEECYRRGANAYMVKSINFGQFAAEFQNAVRFWTQANRRAE